jgi:hypothetical protein
MFTRRTLLKRSGYAVLATSVPMLLRTARSQSPTTFNYYISPIGDDNNPGTLASPWSITALNSKQATYSGKSVGIIGDVSGTQTPIQYGTIGGVQTTLYSVMQAMTTGAALKINGGTSSASTYIASCTSAGVYQARWAIIDGANPSGGAAPVSASAILMGQPFYETNPVPNPGYCTLDGLVVRNANYAAVMFGDIQGTTLYGIIIQNCQIYDCICGTSIENPGAIFLGNCNAPQVLNCKIYNCTTSGGSFYPWGMGGITSYRTVGLVVTNCTIYGCGYSIQMKDTNQWATISYSYLDCGNLSSWENNGQSAVLKAIIPGAGETLTLHHNIICGSYDGSGEDGTLITGAVTAYNNTFYSPLTQFLAAYFNSASSAVGPFNFYNNIVYATGYANGNFSPGALWVQNKYGITATSVNYNYYGTGMTFATAFASGSLNLPFSTWRGYGYDANSALGGNPFSSTPSLATPSSFAITGPATTAGRNGAACGALDGTGTVGCNFATSSTTPKPPVLISVT